MQIYVVSRNLLFGVYLDWGYILSKWLLLSWCLYTQKRECSDTNLRSEIFFFFCNSHHFRPEALSWNIGKSFSDLMLVSGNSLFQSYCHSFLPNIQCCILQGIKTGWWEGLGKKHFHPSQYVCLSWDLWHTHKESKNEWYLYCLANVLTTSPWMEATRKGTKILGWDHLPHCLSR